MNNTKTSTASPSDDRVNYKSADGLVTIITKVSSAKRWPQHGYPVVCLQFRPRKGTRVQQLPDGQGIDVLLNHEEVASHIDALNEADPKAGYKVPHVPRKSLDRKAKWDEINRKRRNKGGNN